jgi:hypothetical protein
VVADLVLEGDTSTIANFLTCPALISDAAVACKPLILLDVVGAPPAYSRDAVNFGETRAQSVAC